MGAVDAEPAPIFAFAKNRYVQIGAVAIGAILLIALTVYALLRVPRVRDALRDVWPFKLMIQTARKKKAPARPFYDDSSCDDNDDERVVRHEPPALSALSRIVLLNEHAEKDARDERRAEPAVEECVDDARDERDEREHEHEKRERDEQHEREREQREEREKHEKRGAATFSRRKRAA
jgi:hypothetical protein